MKPIISLLCVMLCLCATLFLSSCQPDPQDPNEEFKIRIYNAVVAEAEQNYLSTLDSAELSPNDQLEKITREGDLQKILGNLKATGRQYWATMEAQYIRIPPGIGPTPCPIPWGCGQLVGIEDVNLGVVMVVDSLPDDPGARMTSIPEPTATFQLDKDHVFAIGKIMTPADSVFRTARFHFTVVDGSLKSKDLILLITSSIVEDGKIIPVEMKVPVPANSFTLE